MDDERTTELFWTGLGGLASLLVAAALVPARTLVPQVDVALVLVAVVVIVAASGGRKAGAVSAVMAALSFDFFHTRPYLQVRIASIEDVATTVVFLLVALIAGTVAARARQARKSAQVSKGEIRRIYHVAELAARGKDASEVILAAQDELTALLRLRACRFEAPPFASTFERLERSGVLSWREYRLRSRGFELPDDGVELPVLGRGQLLGRFVLTPTPGVGVSLEERIVAVALADQVGAVLVVPEPARGR